MTNSRMPVVFAGHGSPMNAIESNKFSEAWSALGKKLPKPKAILAISAHWYTKGTHFQSDENPQLIYDFYGFPKELYEVKYPVKGDLTLTSRLEQLLKGKATVDNSWGIDHGTWSVLRAMYPDADVPIVQLSIDQSLSMEACFELGALLKPLKEEGILIVGSGNVVHSFKYIDFKMSTGHDWADAFDTYIYNSIIESQYEQVIHYEKEGLNYHKAFQTLEHFAPLIYILGAAEAGEKVEVFNRSCEMGSMSMTSYVIGDYAQV